MKKLSALILVLFALSCAPGMAMTPAQKNYYMSLNGKYPGGSKFFANKVVSERLKRLLGDRYFLIIDNTAVQYPIKVSGGFLVTEGSALYADGEEEGMVAIDLKKDIFYAGLLRKGDSVTIYREQSTKTPGPVLNWIEWLKKKIKNDLAVSYRTKLKPRKSPVYKNFFFGFTVLVPEGYKRNEFPQEGTKEGIDLTCGRGTITVRAMPAGTDYQDVPFEEYVRFAASVEIQNYSGLDSIESYSADQGINGFKTWWKVTETLPDDGGDVIMTKDSIKGPIYYFPPKKDLYLSNAPVKTIMISSWSKDPSDESVARDAAGVARSFEYY